MIGTPGGTADRPALFFRDATEFRAWLEANHETASELWMGLRKVHVPDRGLTWEDAVPEALCFGWIDSRAERIDEDTRRQRWTPRRPGSVWSSVNIAHVERLLAAGRMHPAGVAAYERRRPERSGVYAYETAGEPDPDVAADLAARFAADPAAAAFWAHATPSYRRIATTWVTSAKRPQTREKRLAALVVDCAAGRLIPSQRYGAEPAWVRKARAALGGAVED